MPSPPIQHHIESAEVFQAISNPACLQAWESIRSQGRAVTIDRLAADTQATPEATRATVQQLLSAKLVEVLPHTEDQPEPTFRTVSPRLVITFDPNNPTSASKVNRVMNAAPQPTNQEGVTAPTAQLERAMEATLHVSDQQILDFFRLFDGADEVVARYDEGRPRHREHGQAAPNIRITMKFERIGADQPPIPAVRFLPSGNSVQEPAPLKKGISHGLSPREREVAALLAGGSTQAEAAGKLGISTTTVATLTRRVYKKLGATRRAELVNRLREISFGTA